MEAVVGAVAWAVVGAVAWAVGWAVGEAVVGAVGWAVERAVEWAVGGFVIVFVGDKPGKKNKDPKVPFVGTQSYKRLLEWIWKLDLDISDIKLINQEGFEYFKASDRVYYNKVLLGNSIGIIFIALGKNAEKKLQDSGIECFNLPHPSGLNRVLNDKKYLESVLKKCKKWLESKK